MSENGSFKSFLCLLLRSEKYQSEAKKIIDLVNDWDTKRLAEYGLDETKNYEDWEKRSYMIDANTALREWEEKRPKYNDKYNQSKSGW